MNANQRFWHTLGQRKNPDWIVAPDVLDWRTADEQSRKLASLFAGSLGSGDRVVLALAHDREFLVALLACLRAGLVPVLVDPLAKPREAMQLLADHQPEGLCYDADSIAWHDSSINAGRFTLRFERGAAKQGALFRKLLGKQKPASENPDTYPGILAQTPPMPSFVSRADADLAYILFTSGTTSKPKGVEISWLALVTHLDSLARHYRINATSRVLNVLPMHHTDGSVFGALTAAWADASLHRPMAFSIQKLEPLLHGIYRDRISHFIAAPVMLSMILKLMQQERDAFKTADFDCVISTAGHLEAHLWQQFENTFGVRVANHYGLTETVTGSLAAGPDDASHRIGTLGKPVDCECRIVDGQGQDVAEGEAGELWIRGNHVMTGYHRNAEATQETLHDGWLKTGDKVSRDGEGFYHLQGRIKNLIISGGRNIAPEAITAVLHQHPAVKEAVTIGLPDADWGERVIAAVVTSASTTENDLIAYCRDQLAEYQVPKHIVQLDSLPRGPSGKVQLPLAKAAIEAALQPQGQAHSGNVQERVFAIASDILRAPTDTLRPETGPDNTSGWDSLAHMALVEALEREFGVTLSARDIMSLGSLGDAITIVNTYSTTTA
ncbi:MAG: hypothetical protein EP312_06225 [Gammaproteobacteria bacterium]|nr:MAG: hypothetical protein EP312_06225 [Gammaproteobacteria bacterium]